MVLDFLFKKGVKMERLESNSITTVGILGLGSWKHGLRLFV
nr:MAG TPA: hypothetical protein [Caudoviricetes sp.]